VSETEQKYYKKHNKKKKEINKSQNEGSFVMEMERNWDHNKDQDHGFSYFSFHLWTHEIRGRKLQRKLFV